MEERADSDILIQKEIDGKRLQLVPPKEVEAFIPETLLEDRQHWQECGKNGDTAIYISDSSGKVTHIAFLKPVSSRFITCFISGRENKQLEKIIKADDLRFALFEYSTPLEGLEPYLGSIERAPCIHLWKNPNAAVPQGECTGLIEMPRFGLSFEMREGEEKYLLSNILDTV